MPYTAGVFRVMIASPGDVAVERYIIRETVHEWNVIHSADRQLVLLPVGWETHAAPAVGRRPQEIINSQLLHSSDLLVAVFWTRIGTPTGKAVSGTVEEIDEHVAGGKPAMVYFSELPVPTGGKVSRAQLRGVKQFRRIVTERGWLIERYASLPEFRDKFARQLALTVIRHFTTDRTRRPDDETPPDASRPRGTLDATILLWEATHDPSGIIRAYRTDDGLQIATNGKQFVTRLDDGDEARWKAALDRLQSTNLVLAESAHEFRVTPEGYQIADLLGRVG